ncbi:MAG: NAD(P)/FAD-dependent oxidoreductase [Ignavibacteriales bacterium]
MIRINNIKMPITSNIEDLRNKCLKILKTTDLISFEILKKSVDARDKNKINFIYTVDVEIKNEDNIILSKDMSKIEGINFEFSKSNKVFRHRPIIVGAGPAGLFTALGLVKSGIKCLLIEQGKCVEERKKDIDNFFNNGILNPDSNVQFGEGGAGTFSDGKLTTGINDERIRYVLETFVEFGAPKEILFSSKPHIGTDMLINVIKNMRNFLISNGCEIRFNTKLTDLIIENLEIIGVIVNENEKILTDHLILAIGHSARKTYEMLYNNNVRLEQKNFAMGVRIEHKQSTIQENQYGKYADFLDPTDYKLVTHLDNNHSVYTFCVCPGGYVVAASSEEGHLAINGMSEYKRDNENINGALLVSVSTNDFGSDHPLAGMYLQRKIEYDAFTLGGSNYNAPCQRVDDFLNNRKSIYIGSIKPSYKPNITLCNLHDCLPNFMTESLKKALLEFDRKIKGFAFNDALLTAVESRSSAPVRIVRNENFKSISISKLYPIGEGAGYAGGIMSSAIDGIKCAIKILK